MIGLVGSVLGVIVGVALTSALVAGLSVAGVSLPGSGIAIEQNNVIGAILGTIITLVSVMIPARRTARTEPIEALRDAAVETGVLSKSRGITSAVMIVLGLLSGCSPADPWLSIGLGILLLVVGVIVAGPFIAVGGAALARPLVNRAGLEARLAVDNSARNPKRTATTANALLIGVFLVTLVTVAGTSVKDFVVVEIQNLQGADFTISSNGGSIDDGLVAEARVDQGRRAGHPVPAGVGDHQRHPVAALDDRHQRCDARSAKIEADKGSLDDLGPGHGRPAGRRIDQGAQGRTGEGGSDGHCGRRGR